MRRLLVLALVLVAAAARAQTPTVSSYSGTLSGGNSITVTGTNFGTTGPTVQVFDDFEGGTNGNAIAGHAAVIGTWKSDTPSQVPRYYNGDHISGSQVMRVDTAVDDGLINGSGLAISGLNTLDIFYRAFVKLATGDVVPGHGNATNYKMFWAYNHCCDINDFAYPSTNDDSAAGAGTASNWQGFGNDNPVSTSGNSFWVPPCGSGGYTPCSGAGDWIMHMGKWSLIMVYFHGDSADHATAVSRIWTLSPDEPRALTLHWDTDHSNFGHATSNTLTEWAINGFTNHTTTGSSKPMYDDVYMATSSTAGAARARVEIGNASTYAACSNLTIVTTTAWSGSSVTGVVRQGSFGASAGAWLYVTNSSGNVNAAGFAATFGQAGGGGGGGGGGSKQRYRFLRLGLWLLPVAAVTARRRF